MLTERPARPGPGDLRLEAGGELGRARRGGPPALGREQRALDAQHRGLESIGIAEPAVLRVEGTLLAPEGRRAAAARAAELAAGF